MASNSQHPPQKEPINTREWTDSKNSEWNEQRKKSNTWRASMASESTSLTDHSELVMSEPLEPASEASLMTKPTPPLAFLESFPGIV